MRKPFSIPEYEAAIAALNAVSPSFGAVGSAAYKPGLERMEASCRALGNPERKFPCIHVAGTNGKGSTSNMLAAHYAGRGLRVGLYTSPHLLDFRERIRIVSADGFELIPREAVWDFLQERPAGGDLSFFELTTLMAFWYFAREKVDLAVLECGLGGRLDATNVVTPLLSVITNIGFDHMDILGHTLAEIAGEKAGIIKQGRPALLGEPNDEILPVFEAVSRNSGARLYVPDEICDGCPDGASTSDLKGDYQRLNRRTVASALKILGEDPDWDSIGRAAAMCGFRGRWEQLSSSPFTIADIGHNAHGLRHNFAQLDALIAGGVFSHLVMVYGSVADKDVDAVLEIMPRRAEAIFFTQAPTPRALPAEELMGRFVRIHTGRRMPLLSAHTLIGDALSHARALCAKLEKPLLYIGGSTYIVSGALSSDLAEQAG